jgi:hypothetical protein
VVAAAAEIRHDGAAVVPSLGPRSDAAPERLVAALLPEIDVACHGQTPAERARRQGADEGAQAMPSSGAASTPATVKH